MSRLNIFQTRPKVSPINVYDYLRRIDVKREVPSPAFLKKIQKNHLLHIPYENLDIHYNKEIYLEVDPIYKKVVDKKRGGIGLELNYLLYHLLANLGFQCVLIGAKSSGAEGFEKTNSHLLNLVSFKEEVWLVDVGLMNGFIDPKKLIPGLLQLDYNNYFRFEQNADNEFILKKSSDTIIFNSVYKFELEEVQPIEFIERLNFLQKDPASELKQNKLISKLFLEGRVTLTDRKLISNLHGKNVEEDLLNEDQFLVKLEEYFQITLQDLLQ